MLVCVLSGKSVHCEAASTTSQKYVFPPCRVVEDLRCAAQVAASLPQPASTWRGSSRGWRGPYNGNSEFRGRRGYRGPHGFRGASQRRGYSQYQQHQQQQPDVYEQLVEGGS